MEEKNLVAIITGPSAVGKTTIAKEVLKKLKNFKPSTTYTTRPQRKESEDKKMYYISEKDFRQMIDDDQFIEWAQVHGNFYGTSKEDTLKTLENHNILMNIDVQGAKIIKKKFPRHISIFIMPEKISDIAERINQRDMPKVMKERRIQNASYELEQAPLFDYRITNYNGRLKDSVEQVLKILKKY